MNLLDTPEEAAPALDALAGLTGFTDTASGTDWLYRLKEML